MMAKNMFLRWEGELKFSPLNFNEEANSAKQALFFHSVVYYPLSKRQLKLLENYRVMFWRETFNKKLTSTNFH